MQLYGIACSAGPGTLVLRLHVLRKRLSRPFYAFSFLILAYCSQLLRTNASSELMKWMFIAFIFWLYSHTLKKLNFYQLNSAKGVFNQFQNILFYCIFMVSTIVYNQLLIYANFAK